MGFGFLYDKRVTLNATVVAGFTIEQICVD
jgi:hypothetical protein